MQQQRLKQQALMQQVLMQQQQQSLYHPGLLAPPQVFNMLMNLMALWIWFIFFPWLNVLLDVGGVFELGFW